MLKEFIKYVSLNVFSMLGVSVYVLCDTFFIANGIGTDALSGLNLVLPFFAFICAVGIMLGSGTAIRYSILCGQNRFEEARKTIFHGSITALILGVLISIFGFIYTNPIAELMGADKTLMKYATDYISVIFMFAWALIINQLFMCLTRAAGFPKIAMIAGLVSSFSNLFLDIIFIYHCKWGNWGAAFASGLAPCFAIIIQFYYFIFYRKIFKFEVAKLNLKKIIDICCLGFPSFVTEISTGVVMTCFNFKILELSGNIGIAAYSIIANIAIVVAAMFTGVAQGIQPLISLNFGAGKKEAVHQVSRYAYITTTLMSISAYLLFYIFSKEIINVFNSSNNLALTSLADTGLKIYYLCLVFMGANTVTTSILASKTQSLKSFLLSLCRAILFVIPLLYLLSYLFGIIGVWATIPVTEFITMLIFLFGNTHISKDSGTVTVTK